MTTQQAKYELLKEHNSDRNNYTCLRACALVLLCTASTIAVFTTWNFIYKQSLNIPPQLVNIPEFWIKRAQVYSFYFTNADRVSYNKTTTLDDFSTQDSRIDGVKQIGNERIYPSKLGNFIYKSPTQESDLKLVCYYAAPPSTAKSNQLYPQNIDPHLCTHINVGLIEIENNRLVIDDRLIDLFNQTKELKIKNKNLKILLWVGGAESKGFSEMVANHANRKLFIQSLKEALETYRLDGIDLDWEFPSAYRRERQHFSQLLHEIRREYQREHRTYLLSVAAAAPEGIVYFAYDIGEINNYADYVNIMTYDYHFYTPSTPFTGLNAPLYARQNEYSLLGTLNINYTVNYWESHGLNKSKIVIGLPTYGHSFRLVNPYNNKIGSPAESIGRVGTMGFASYSEICWFKQNNIYVQTVYDVDTCSPYVYSGLEWISYEDERSLECKTQFIKENGYGGAMIFSLNTDDYASHCEVKEEGNGNLKSTNSTFPLLRKIHSILFENIK